MSATASCRRLPAPRDNGFLRPPTNRSVRAIAQTVLLIVGMSGVAHANSEVAPAASAEEPRSNGERSRALAVSASLVPGVLVHGSGHYALGDRRTAWRLLKMEGLGIALMGVGGGLLGATGSDEHPAALYVPLLAGGAALFAGSFLADLLGVSLSGLRAGTSATVPTRLRPDALGSTSLGYRFVSHPSLGDSHLLRATASVRAGPATVAVAAEAASSNRYRAFEGEATYRLPWRPLAAAKLEAGFDIAHRRLPSGEATSSPAALWLEAAWLLDRYVPRLPGAYARGRLGFGVESVDYAGVAGRSDDLVPFVVAIAGIGLRLGRLDVEANYDQRQDGLPGGGFYGRLPGMLGSIGLAGRLGLTSRWALTGETRYGTGITTWIAAEHSF